MDVGESLNPGVDIGQIEGAFIQGVGLFTIEELLFSPKGHLLTKGPGTYKIPTMTDIPQEFYVSMLRGATNPKAVYSSKVNLLIIIICFHHHTTLPTNNYVASKAILPVCLFYSVL